MSFVPLRDSFSTSQMKTDRDKVSHDVLPYSVLLWSLCVCLCVCWWLIWLVEIFVGLDGDKSNYMQVCFHFDSLHGTVHSFFNYTTNIYGLLTWKKYYICLCVGKKSNTLTRDEGHCEPVGWFWMTKRTMCKGSKLISLPLFTSLPPASISPYLISHRSLHSRAFQTYLWSPDRYFPAQLISLALSVFFPAAPHCTPRGLTLNELSNNSGPQTPHLVTPTHERLLQWSLAISARISPARLLVGVNHRYPWKRGSRRRELEGMGIGVRMTAMRRFDYRGGTQGEQRSAASGLTSRLQSKWAASPG